MAGYGTGGKVAVPPITKRRKSIVREILPLSKFYLNLIYEELHERCQGCCFNFLIKSIECCLKFLKAIEVYCQWVILQSMFTSNFLEISLPLWLSIDSVSGHVIDSFLALHKHMSVQSKQYPCEQNDNVTHSLHKHSFKRNFWEEKGFWFD